MGYLHETRRKRGGNMKESERQYEFFIRHQHKNIILFIAFMRNITQNVSLNFYTSFDSLPLILIYHRLLQPGNKPQA